MAMIGTKITRYISVPFEGCDSCRYLSPETETVYANGQPYVVFTKCANENLCLEAVKAAGKAADKE